MRFQVFKDGKIVDKFPLCGAYLFGSDGIPIRNPQITFKKGLVECKKTNAAAAGLTLLWPVEGFGRVLLPTTILPESDRPYNLNLEITRAKLMQMVNKREDWSYFSLAGSKKAAQEAQELFIKAIQNISDPCAASKLADESLKKAIVLSEDFATKQAEDLFEARRKNRGFGRGFLGCRIDPAQINKPTYLDKLLELFEFVTIPIRWSQIEKERGVYDFSSVDACINILSKKKLTMGAGPLLCFSEYYLPKWLLQSKMGFEKIRECAYRFVSEAATRYAGVIRTWCVLSALNSMNHFGFNFEQILEVTRTVNMAVKAADERARRVILIREPWGEYYASEAGTIPPLVYMDMVVQSGISFDAFGIQMQFGENKPGMYVRDMMHISALLDHYAPVAKPFYVAGVAVPSQSTARASDETAAVWHEQWSQAQQSKWIEKFYKIALSKPYVEAVTYSYFADTKHDTVSHSGLLNEQLEPKQAFLGLKKLHTSIFNR